MRENLLTEDDGLRGDRVDCRHLFSGYEFMSRYLLNLVSFLMISLNLDQIITFYPIYSSQ